jgi:phosphoribosylaminoimidazole-succinocarboxamide synthase
MEKKSEGLTATDLGALKPCKRGKVRDIYDCGDNLLIISTDRISCFDVVLPCAIPFKGIVLNSISCFWFDFIKDIVPNHMVSCEANAYPLEFKKHKDMLLGRSMLVKKSKPLAVECVVRGYLSGSGWKEYKEKQSVCGIKLPGGLVESEKLPEVLFTPSTKEDVGHDVNVNQKYVENLLGRQAAEKIKETSLAIYHKASQYALERGIIIADTKFEFGLYQDEIILIDELLTPDSSRFWPKDRYKKGRPQPSFDKQFVRDYLEYLRWNKTPPAPKLPQDIITKTSQKYLEGFKRLTGNDLKI